MKPEFSQSRQTSATLRQYLGPPAMALLLAIQNPVHAQTRTTYADVAPIFVKSCIICHSGETPPAGLRLDKLDSIVKGSDKGPVVKAGAPGASELVRRIKGISQPRMPMTGPPFLSDGEIATIERWIADGLQPAGPSAAPPAVMSETRRPGPGEKVTYQHVAPIFAARCAKCHTDGGLMGAAPEGFRLTSYASTLAASDRARVVPGNPGASELVRRIRGQARPRMPLDGPPYLNREEIRLIEDWVSQGAASSEGVPSPVPAGATVRLHGILGPDGRLDGLDLVFRPHARTDKDAIPGAYVQVRGRIDQAGRIEVERMRSR